MVPRLSGCLKWRGGCPGQDLAKDRAQHYKKARRFFDGVAAQLVQQQHSLDVFACALDQVQHRSCLGRSCLGSKGTQLTPSFEPIKEGIARRTGCALHTFRLYPGSLACSFGLAKGASKAVSPTNPTQ
jgi:hypothetical protein